MKDNTLLVTGGTGSFGKAVVKSFLEMEVGSIIIFSRDEAKQEAMRFEFSDPRLRFVIGDVRDSNRVHGVMAGVDYVYHAAALKQVPTCEFNPMEAIKTNVIGTQNIINAALERDVKKCVFLSTDKAVYPINAMGMTKALMEKLVVSASNIESNTVFSCTRYGNVMASRGSVIPLFLDQIRRNQPVTITDPNMTRFLMSLQDSVELVSYAFENAKGGDIFVQKQPSSTVGDLAEALLALSPNKVPISYIGTRHGEKLYETLISREEMLRADEYDKYYRIRKDSRGLDYSVYETEGSTMLTNTDDYDSHNCERLAGLQLQNFLKEKLPGHFDV